MKFRTKSWIIQVFSFTRSYTPVSSRMMRSYGDYIKWRNILSLLSKKEGKINFSIY